jgi:hypothetical protein
MPPAARIAPALFAVAPPVKGEIPVVLGPVGLAVADPELLNPLVETVPLPESADVLLPVPVPVPVVTKVEYRVLFRLVVV